MPKTVFQYGSWARCQCYSSGFFVFTAGLISLYYPNMYIAIANIVAGLLIMGLEGPWPGFNKLGFVSSNYYFRSFFYFLCLGAMPWYAPTQTAGMLLMSGVITYLRAAINKESWQDPAAKKGGKGGAAGGKGGNDASKAPKA